ncbi:MarR family transcriptional regulator [Amycolatopsis cynarae]|uniref:MarR family transcriptional regulator n=1 Tax=Amycolatopsis cynarae TaxID=2995223 RepID=A0ABY7B2D4_9PSEU|nr:MarR family transcriptional regulator [Amycolatopsis sp. HUAS 11-8]WAL66460.1 MarR family transcriptional regulator [Amycolatopsis sp. HUAS 11-8]
MSSRDEVIARLTELMRGASTYRLLMHQVIADRLGLIMTDLKCLDAARDEPRLTPGRLAEITGLSTSATTAALDRLERRGFVRRIRDEHDRRRVFVESTGQHEAETARLFSPLVTATTAILDNYTDEQLALITDFLEQLNAVNAQLTRQQKESRPRP